MTFGSPKWFGQKQICGLLLKSIMYFQAKRTLTFRKFVPTAEHDLEAEGHAGKRTDGRDILPHMQMQIETGIGDVIEEIRRVG